MERDYIATLNDEYEKFFDDYFQGVPVLRIETGELDIVSDADAQGEVEQRIRKALAEAPRQTELPLS
jgi:deoxyadenosine/deoxycytidine kinase